MAVRKGEKLYPILFVECTQPRVRLDDDVSSGIEALLKLRADLAGGGIISPEQEQEARNRLMIHRAQAVLSDDWIRRIRLSDRSPVVVLRRRFTSLE